MSDPIVDPLKCPGTPELERITPLDIDCEVPPNPEPIREGNRIDVFGSSPSNFTVLQPPPTGGGGGGGGGGTVQRVYPLVDCRGILPTICAANNLSAYVGKFLRLDTCREVQSSTTDMSECSQLVFIPPTLGIVFDDCETCHGCYLLTGCIDPEDILVSNTNLLPYVGKVVRLDTGLCYTVTYAPNCVNAEPVTVIGVYDNCTYCGNCFHLAECHSAGTLSVYNDLAELTGKTPAEMITDGDAFRISGVCYYITEHSACSETSEHVEVDVVYEDCSECSCYELTECGNEENVVYAHSATDADDNPLNLEDYVGRVVQLDDEFCYSVAQGGDCGEAQTVVIISDHSDCDACQHNYRYRLVHDCPDIVCEGEEPAEPEDDKITDEDLSEAVGQWIRAGGHCWKVETADDEESVSSGFDAPLAYNGPYTTCEDCTQEANANVEVSTTASWNSTTGDIDVSTTTIRYVDGQLVVCDGEGYTITLPICISGTLIGNLSSGSSTTITVGGSPVTVWGDGIRSGRYVPSGTWVLACFDWVSKKYQVAVGNACTEAS